MNNKKVQKVYIDNGFGFPVQILNAPFKKVRNSWVLDLNLEVYEENILLAVAQKRSRLTGNEVRFVRQSFSMTTTEFGKRFGDNKHSAVLNWEKKSDTATKMNWATEKDIRLAIIEKIKPKMIIKLYKDLEESLPERKRNIKISAEDLFAA